MVNHSIETRYGMACPKVDAGRHSLRCPNSDQPSYLMTRSQHMLGHPTLQPGLASLFVKNIGMASLFVKKFAMASLFVKTLYFSPMPPVSLPWQAQRRAAHRRISDTNDSLKHSKHRAVHFRIVGASCAQVDASAFLFRMLLQVELPQQFPVYCHPL